MEFKEIRCDYEISSSMRKRKNKSKNNKSNKINNKAVCNKNKADENIVKDNSILVNEPVENDTNNINGLGVLNIKVPNLKNSFINTVQEKERQCIKEEKKRLDNMSDDFPYIKCKCFLTEAEKQLYHFLENNITLRKRIIIVPKVRLADIIEVDEKKTLDKKFLYKIAYKHVDFLIIEKGTLNTVCVIELDDFTHDNDKSRDRDFFVMEALRRCGIETARIRRPIKNIEKSDIEYADTLINTVLAPKCPYCGLKMVPKKSRTGHRFWSCINYINKCRYTINIDETGVDLP